MTKNKHAVRGSELALGEAVAGLYSAIHTGQVNNKTGPQGRLIAEAVEKHVGRINAALQVWRDALAHYEEMHK